MEVMLFAGDSLAKATEAGFNIETNDGVDTYSVDFMKVLVVVVKPEKNKDVTGIDLEYWLDGSTEIDAYNKYY